MQGIQIKSVQKPKPKKKGWWEKKLFFGGKPSYLGRMSDPWHMKQLIPHQSELERDKMLSSSSGSSLQGWGFSHSLGDILTTRNNSRIFF